MELRNFFRINNKAAVAFSGGVDSTYLLYAALQAGADVRAYYVRSQFQPAFEFEDACEAAELIGAEMKVIHLDVLSDETVRVGEIIRAAASDGYDLVVDGTNASDDLSDRPGARALKELGVRSPLRECGITKPEVRQLSRDAGLPVWNKPAYACLATRIPCGEEITAEKLAVTEKAESAVYNMGFSDFRVRMRGTDALLQVRADQYEKAEAELGEIRNRLAGLYRRVELDTLVR